MKTKVYLIIISSLLLISIVIGISYAVWLVTKTQTNNNLLSTECFDITFTEDANSNINLLSTYPILDIEGSTLIPYTFSIENICDINAAYQINLEVYDTTTLSHNLIKSMLDNNTPSIITDKEIVSSTIANTTSYKLDTYYLSTNQTNNHEFRMWIDGSGTLSNSQNKLVEAKITISAIPTEEIPYKDSILKGSDPVLDTKMIPVTIESNGVIKVANTTEEWYNYTNSEWANAVIVDPTFTTLDPGTTIPMESIEQMYVWIPRYEYKISSINTASESIEINFVSPGTLITNENMLNEDIIIHPAFCWGDYCQTNRNHQDNIELAGIWVGKFETGTDNTIKPNQNSINNLNVSTLYDNINNAMTTYNLDSKTDVHMIQNTEWGAIAYLSQSQYGICEDNITCAKKVENNNYADASNHIITGCGGNDTHIVGVCPSTNTWETENGIKASTTHNITGIYDMAGGKYEYTMGNTTYSNGLLYPSQSGFTEEISYKYYDVYLYGSSHLEYHRSITGDALKELKPTGTTNTNWNNDAAAIMNKNYTFAIRGGGSASEELSGIFFHDSLDGRANTAITTRSTLIIEK